MKKNSKKEQDLIANKIRSIEEVDFEYLHRLAADKKNKSNLIELKKVLNSIEIKGDRIFVERMLLLAEALSGTRLADLAHDKILESGDIRWDVYIDMAEVFLQKIPEIFKVILGSFFTNFQDKAHLYFEKRGHEFALRMHRYLHSKEYRETTPLVWSFYIDKYWPRDFYDNIN